MMTERPDHDALANDLRRQTLEGSGVTAQSLRQAAAARASGGPPMKPPYDELARQIGVCATGVTDGQVHDVVCVEGSEKAVFEIIVASALGAGLLRWRVGMDALREAINAAG